MEAEGYKSSGWPVVAPRGPAPRWAAVLRENAVGRRENVALTGVGRGCRLEVGRYRERGPAVGCGAQQRICQE
jgi:hypothetical protein